MSTINELQRMSYLGAMGIDSYISRGQLPGAAASRRLAIVELSSLDLPDLVPDAKTPSQSPEMPTLDRRPKPRQSAESGPVSAAPPMVATTAVRFNLVAVFVGGAAWLESLDDRPLASEQVKLIHAMARAIHREAATPKVAQFEWPMHNSRQLDQGADAARAALSAFLMRHIEEQKCRALVSLGEAAAEYVNTAALGEITHVTTHSTIDMLEKPACKRQVWSDLQAIVLRG
jgi:hypothetical protein